MTGERREIPFEKLVLDQDNPRLLRHQDSQREAIRAMIERHGEDVLGLAQHIVSYGRDFSDLMKVVPDTEEAGYFVVLDGNRRLTAYKILETLTLLPDDAPASLRKRFIELAKTFKGPPASELCVVYESREEAYPFIEIAHRGKLGGAGRTSWSGHAGARFDELTGKEVPHLAFLRAVSDAGTLSETAQMNLDNFPISTLERLVKTPLVAATLGFQIRGSKVLAQFPAHEFLKGATKMVEDLATGVKNSRSLNNISAREEYAKELRGAGFRPDPRKKLPQPVALDELIPKQGSPKKPSPPTKPDRPRATLAPPTLEIPIQNPRLNALFSEMKTVNLNKHKNIAAVLLRVFLEWSVEEYIRKHNLVLGSSAKQDKQGRRLLEVANHMQAKGFATPDELKAIRVAADNRNHLINIETLHGYVHNTSFMPTALDVRESWDQLENFLALLHLSYQPTPSQAVP